MSDLHKWVIGISIFLLAFGLSAAFCWMAIVFGQIGEHDTEEDLFHD